MAEGETKKDAPVNKPAPADSRTTPYGTPPPAGATVEFELSGSALSDLSQRYDIHAEVGRGGMGIVYRARDRETGDVVALKVLRPEIALRPELIDRFKSELLLARKVTHKNVCRTYELLRFGDTVAIAMEYVEGESLRSLLKRVEALPVRRGLKILRQVLTGLAEAHAQGVVHRDLKPENLVITGDNQVKVMDFGIARSVEAQATQTGGIIGTPAYMSPEQAEGKPVDARTDIYALGLIIYEMFVGCPAFQAETPVGLAYKQIHEKPAPPRSVDPYLPVFLERVIEKCLEKDPKKRFQSAAELEAALEEQAVTEAPAVEPVPPPHLSRWAKADWFLLALGLLGLIYFLQVQDTVFPAGTRPLELDAISARKTADDLARKLGRPFSEGGEARLEFRGEWYRYEILSRIGGTPPYRRIWDLPGAVREAELPLYWRIQYRSPMEAFAEDPTESPAPFVVLDRKGRVVEFAHPYPPRWPFPSYQAPPVEQRRTLARQATELACGAMPPDLTLVEYSGGEQGVSYHVTWIPRRPVESAPWAEVAMLAEHPVSIKCKFAPAAPWLDLMGMHSGWIFQSMFRLAMAVVAVMLLIFFAIGEAWRSHSLRKRVPLAAFLGFTGAWLLSRTFDVVPNTAATSPPPSIPVLLVGGLAASGLLLVGLVTAEHYLVRRAPAWIATFALAMKGKLNESSVGLSVVRGALAGLALAGAQTSISHLSMAVARLGNKPAGFAIVMFGSFADPTGLGLALSSWSPSAFVVCAAIFNGVIIGLVVMGSQWSINGYREFLKYQNRKSHQAVVLFGLASIVTIVALGLRLHFGQALGPGICFTTVPIVMSLLLAFLLVRYDVLTVIVAVATTVLWTLNYPLLRIFGEVGNSGPWAVFIGWGVLVAAAAALAFRAQLDRARERLRAQME